MLCTSRKLASKPPKHTYRATSSPGRANYHSISDFPHPTNSTAAIVVNRRCFILIVFFSIPCPFCPSSMGFKRQGWFMSPGRQGRTQYWVLVRGFTKPIKPQSSARAIENRRLTHIRLARRKKRGRAKCPAPGVCSLFWLNQPKTTSRLDRIAAPGQP